MTKERIKEIWDAVFLVILGVGSLGYAAYGLWHQSFWLGKGRKVEITPERFPELFWIYVLAAVVLGVVLLTFGVQEVRRLRKPSGRK